MLVGTVKTERRDDDPEIEAMAKKIAETNRAKAAAANPVGYPGNPAGLTYGRQQGQPLIQNYLQGQKGAGAAGASSCASSSSEEKKLDGESRKGRFGWCSFERNELPYIFRSNAEKFTSVRMVERKFLNKFLSALPSEVNSCHCIRSYFITESESKLLNDINIRHADGHFGKEQFTNKDLVVRLSDAKEFYRFLDLCYKKLVLKKSNATDRCGFFRINGESVVPYTVRETIKYVPLFYFEGETDHLKLKSDSVEGWDLAYLKFCCKVQGIRNELFASDVCRVVALDEIKGHFPPGTTFEDYWPAKGSIEPLNTRQSSSAGHWTQKPNHGAAAPTAAHGTSSASIGGGGTSASRSQHLSQQQQYQQQQLSRQQQAMNAAAVQQHQMLYQQYIRAGMTPPANLVQSLSQATAAVAQASSHTSQPQQQQQQLRTFPGKLTQIKEFTMECSQEAPYQIRKVTFDVKKMPMDHKTVVPCINVRPHAFLDFMVTLPDFVKYFCPDQTVDKAKDMLQDILHIVLYKGNRGHTEVLRAEGKCQMFDPVPLVLMKDIVNYMPQLKYMFNNLAAASLPAPTSKRMRVS